jgi:hypothetical protein
MNARQGIKYKEYTNYKHENMPHNSTTPLGTKAINIHRIYLFIFYFFIQTRFIMVHIQMHRAHITATLISLNKLT